MKHPTIPALIASLSASALREVATAFGKLNGPDDDAGVQLAATIRRAASRELFARTYGEVSADAA